MKAFEAIRLAWGGKEYGIAPDGVMRAIAIIEEVMTIDRLSRIVISRELKLAKLAEAVGDLLRYAGAPVTDPEVYEHWVREQLTHVAEAYDWANVLFSIVARLAPPEHMGGKGEAPPGKPEAASAPVASSPSATSSPSAPAG